MTTFHILTLYDNDYAVSYVVRKDPSARVISSYLQSARWLSDDEVNSILEHEPRSRIKDMDIGTGVLTEKHKEAT